MKKDVESFQGTFAENTKTLIKKCHCCGKMAESLKEIERCSTCQKSFLPLKYFEKIHDVHQQYADLFSHVEEIDEKDLIKGLLVLW